MVPQAAVSAPNPLLFHPRLSLGEGPRAFLRKVADQNGLSLRFLIQSGITFNTDCLRSVGCLPAVGEDITLDVYAAAITKSLQRFPKAWLTGRSRLCPDCLRESSQWRVSWEVMFADACTQHGTWLVDRCDCGRALDWNRPLLSNCRCGRSLTSLCSVECPPAVSALARSVVSAAEGREDPDAAAPIRGLDLGALQRVVLLLGGYSSPQAAGASRKRVRTHSMEDSWNISSTAAEIIEAWPHSFTRVLDGHCAATRRTSAEGRLSGTFGSLYRLLYYRRPPEFEALRRHFEEYIARHWRGALGKRNRRLQAVTVQNAAWLPVSRAAVHLRTTRALTIKRLEGGGAQTIKRTTAAGRTFAVASREVLAVLNGAPEPTLNLGEAAKHLGLSKRRVRDLARCQAIPASRPGGFGSRWVIAHSQFERLMRPVQQASVVQRPPSDAVTFGHVLKYWGLKDELVRTVFAAIVAGELPNLGRCFGQEGLAGLLLPVAKLMEFKSNAVNGAGSDVLTLADVAVRLKLKPQVLSWLIQKKLLAASRYAISMKRRQWIVSEEELERFQERYVFGRALAAQVGCSPRALIQALTSLRVQPESGPAVDGGRQALYARSAELEVAVARLSAERQCRTGMGSAGSM